MITEAKFATSLVTMRSTITKQNSDNYAKDKSYCMESANIGKHARST